MNEDEIESAFYPIFSLNTYPRLRSGDHPVVEKVNSYAENKLQELSSILGEIATESTHLSDIYGAMYSNIWRVLSYYDQLRTVLRFSVLRMLLMAAFIIYDYILNRGGPSIIYSGTEAGGIGFFMVIVFIYEIAYRRALYAKEYHYFQEQMHKNNKYLSDLITKLAPTNRELLIISGNKFSELKENRHWTHIQEAPDDSSAAWGAGDTERKQSAESTASFDKYYLGNHSLIGYITGIIFAVFGHAIVSFTTSILSPIAILGAIIGFMAGRIAGDLLAQSRIGRYIFGAIVVILILYILFWIIGMNIGFGM